MIAASLSLEAAAACRAGRAIGRHPIPETGRLPDEAALGVRCLDGMPVGHPFAVNEHAANSLLRAKVQKDRDARLSSPLCRRDCAAILLEGGPGKARRRCHPDRADKAPR